MQIELGSYSNVNRISHQRFPFQRRIFCKRVLSSRVLSSFIPQVPSTVFYFEAEATLKELVLQRRRWLNGITAGYVWLLRQRSLYEGMEIGRPLSWLVFVLCLVQILTFTVVMSLPGLMAYSTYAACK